MSISVVIPAYNAAKWLPAAVASVRAQIRPADELLVVDDGSKDDTEAVCRSLGVRCVRRENGGLSAARNTGVEATTGEWMLFLDADDTLYPNALASLERKAVNSGAGVVYGFVLQRMATAVEARLHSLPYALGAPPEPARAMFWWTAISTAGSALIKRSLNEEVGGFDENFRQVEDCEYWLRCGVTTSFAHCDEVVLDKTFSTSSLGQQQGTSIWFRLQLQLKFLLWCEHRKIDTSFLKVKKSDLIDHALTRIYRQGSWAILAPVLRQARVEKVTSPWVLRATLRHALMQASGRLPAEPVLCQEVYRKWL